MKNQLSLSFLLVTVCLLLSCSQDKQISKILHVATEGTLSTLITKGEKDQITHLTLTGNLNGDDLRYIREMAGLAYKGESTSGKLTDLDISGAKIVGGGHYYYNPEKLMIYDASDNTIGDKIFYNCKQLTSIRLPNSITSIGVGAFEGCGGLTSIILPESLTSIGDGAFSDCSGLASLILPESVISIGFAAFKNCSGLASLTLPDSIQSWSSGVVSGCKRLKEFQVSAGNTRFSQSDGVLFNFDKTTLIAYPSARSTNYTIPNSVTTIQCMAFAGCFFLTSILLPDSLASIEIGTFLSCRRLTSITLPDRLTSIGDIAFMACDKLIAIHCKAVAPPTVKEHSFNYKETCTLFVPKGSLSAYKKAEGWKNFKSIVEE